MQEGKGVIRGFASGEIKEGKKSERGRKGGMKQGWCGQAARKSLTMGESGSSQGWRWGGCRGGGERGRRELRCPRGGPQSARGLDVRKAASLRPLRDQNRWGGARRPSVPDASSSQRHPRQSPQRSVKGHFFHGAPLGLQSCLSGWKCFASPLNWHITLPHKVIFGTNPRRGEASFSPTRFDWQLLGSREQPEASLPLTREP